MSTTVRLHGLLAQQLGRAEWQFEIQQPREIVAALDANTNDGFRRFLLAHREIEYRVLLDGREIKPVEHPVKIGSQGIPPEFYLVGSFSTIDVIPVPSGAGFGWQTIAGAVLAVVGVALLFTPLAPLAPYAILGGLALAAGGVAQMLAPSPVLGISQAVPNTRAPLITNTERSGGTKLTSYLFNGIANPVGEGGPVPLVYGEMLIGSQIISIGIYPSSLDGATIGGAKAPGPDSYFYDLPLWASLAAQSKAAIVLNETKVKQLTVADLNTAWANSFWMPEKYPLNWGIINLAGKTIATPARRTYMTALSNLFNNKLSAITLAQAKDLYRLLGLTNLSDFDFTHAGWQLVIQILGNYYLNHEFSK